MLLALLTGWTLFSAHGRAMAQAGEPTARDQPATQLKLCCQKIVRDIQRLYYLNNRSGKVKLVVRGIYIHGKSLFFSLRLINRSPLEYDIDSIRFCVVERQRGTHSLERTRLLSPVYVYDSLSSVKGYSRSVGVYVLPQLTLERHHRLAIEVFERNGSRHLLVRASGFTLKTARLI